MRLYEHFACIRGLKCQFVKPIFIEFTCTLGLDANNPEDKMRHDMRVEMRQIRQISQNMVKLWSPAHRHTDQTVFIT